MDNLDKNLYLLDILSQPQAIRLALAKTDLLPLKALSQLVNAGYFDRILLTGMGASYYGLYPAWLHLAAAGLPAVWVDAAELVHHAPAFVTGRTLLWIASQSGHSAEIVSLLRQIENRPLAGLLAMTNDLSSPLAQAVLQREVGGLKALLPLRAEPESTPSTRTYLHTLAIGQLAALCLAQAELAPHLAALQVTADGIAAYLQDWRAQIEQLAHSIGDGTRSIVLVGRGFSLTSALSGALNLQEAAKLPALGLQAAEFRHGPLEMAGPGITVFIFAGDNGSSEQASARSLNLKLWQELRSLGVNAWLFHAASPGGGEGGILSIPNSIGIGLPLAEIIPIQLLCVYLCKQAGINPGMFRHIGKVTTEE